MIMGPFKVDHYKYKKTTIGASEHIPQAFWFTMFVKASGKEKADFTSRLFTEEDLAVGHCLLLNAQMKDGATTVRYKTINTRR